MHSLALIGLGAGFLLIGGGLYALTLRKVKAPPANPNKAQLREQDALAEETRKMRLAAGVIAGLGAALLLLTYL